MNRLFEAVDDTKAFTLKELDNLKEYDNNNGGPVLDAIIAALDNGDIDETTFIQNVLDSWSNSDAANFLKDCGWYDDIVGDIDDEDFYESDELNEDIREVNDDNIDVARKYLNSLYSAKNAYESDRKYHGGYTSHEYKWQKSEIKRIEKLIDDYNKQK